MRRRVRGAVKKGAVLGPKRSAADAPKASQGAASNKKAQKKIAKLAKEEEKRKKKTIVNTFPSDAHLFGKGEERTLAIVQSLNDLLRVHHLHSQLEEKIFFPFLQKKAKNKQITEPFTEQHEEHEHFIAGFEPELVAVEHKPAKGIKNLKKAFPHFQKDILVHLQDEESVMMPIAMGVSWAEAGAGVLRAIKSLSPDDFIFLMQWTIFHLPTPQARGTFLRAVREADRKAKARNTELCLLVLSPAQRAGLIKCNPGIDVVA